MKKHYMTLGRVCNAFNALVPEVSDLSAQHDKLLDEIEKAKGSDRRKLMAKADKLRGKINKTLLGK